MIRIDYFLRHFFCITFLKPPSPLVNKCISVTPQNATKLEIENWQELDQTGQIGNNKVPLRLYLGQNSSQWT